MNRKHVFLMTAVTVALGLCSRQSRAAGWDIDFTTDGVIQESDTYDEVSIYNEATVSMFGGSVAHLYAREQSFFNLNGGSVMAIWAYDSSTVDIVGGTITSVLSITGSSTVNIYDGVMPGTTNVYGYDSGIVNIYGGDIDLSSVKLYPNSKVNIFGGDITLGSFLTDWEGISIYGYDFNYDVDSLTFTASLEYGGQITIDYVLPWEYEYLNLVPEPTSALFLALGGLVLVRKRRLLAGRAAAF